MFLLQESSDIDTRDEQELCDSPVELLHVRVLSITVKHSRPMLHFSEMDVHFVNGIV